MSIAVMAGGTAVATATGPDGSDYFGLTSQGAPVDIQLASGGSRLGYQIEWSAHCRNGKDIAARTSTNPGEGVVVKRNGRFVYQSTASGLLKGFGALDGRNTIRGRIRAGRARGTFIQRVSYTVGGRKVRCTTGKVAWSAGPS